MMGKMVKRWMGVVLIVLACVGSVAMGSGEVEAAPTDKGEFNAVCDDQTISEELRKQAGCEESKTATGVATHVINVAIGVTAVLATISMVVGGIQMATSLGDPARVTKGKAAILYGAIGAVVAALAAVIVNFVIGAIVGQP